MITLQSATSRLTENGAVLQVWNSPARHFLVGDFRWIDSNRVFWFTAHGDREDDGHVLDFDWAEAIDGVGVRFYRDDKLVGLMTDIGNAKVDDPEDYSVAFDLWQQVAPRTRNLIQRSWAQYEG